MLWYFEQKGVDNPERFLGVNEQSIPSPLTPLPAGEGNVLNPENQLSNLPLQNLPLSAEGILSLLKFVYEYASDKGKKTSELEKLIDSLETMTETE